MGSTCFDVDSFFSSSLVESESQQMICDNPDEKTVTSTSSLDLDFTSYLSLLCSCPTEDETSVNSWTSMNNNNNNNSFERAISSGNEYFGNDSFVTNQNAFGLEDIFNPSAALIQGDEFTFYNPNNCFQDNTNRIQQQLSLPVGTCYTDMLNAKMNAFVKNPTCGERNQNMMILPQQQQEEVRPLVEQPEQSKSSNMQINPISQQDKPKEKKKTNLKKQQKHEGGSKIRIMKPHQMQKTKEIWKKEVLNSLKDSSNVKTTDPLLSQNGYFSLVKGVLSTSGTERLIGGKGCCEPIPKQVIRLNCPDLKRAIESQLETTFEKTIPVSCSVKLCGSKIKELQVSESQSSVVATLDETVFFINSHSSEIQDLSFEKLIVSHASHKHGKRFHLMFEFCVNSKIIDRLCSGGFSTITTRGIEKSLKKKLEAASSKDKKNLKL